MLDMIFGVARELAPAALFAIVCVIAFSSLRGFPR